LLTGVRSLRDRDLSTLRRQHPDGNLQPPAGWIHDTDRTISSLRSAKNPQDYRADGPARWKTMRLQPHEFIRRFLLHVLPKGFHRIRHYGLLASANRAESIATARALLGVAPPAIDPQQQPYITSDAPPVLPCPCPHCGARMIVIEVFARGCEPNSRPAPSRIDTS
jgi:Putative transposase